MMRYEHLSWWQPVSHINEHSTKYFVKVAARIDIAEVEVGVYSACYTGFVLSFV
jgi:formate-dependent nitrite reductase membrane component NrfD